MTSIVVASSYVIYPFYHGGARRIFFLSRELSRDHRVTVVTLSRGGPLKYFELEPNLTVIRVPAEDAYLAFERRMVENDIPFELTYFRHWEQCRLYQSILRERLQDSCLAISSRPFSLPAIQDALDGRAVSAVYNSHNVETVQTASVRKNPERLVPLVRAAEQAAVARSAAIAVCTDIDRDGFIADYAAPASKIAVIENGVDYAAVPRVTAEQRQDMRRRLGLDGRFTAVFGGSEYSPNIAAVECILSAAARLPDITFLVVGAVCNHPGFRRALPANVLTLGLLSEAEKWLASLASDLALNPVIAGSGSNVKMFEYAAAGLPILSTKFGARGTGFQPDIHCYEATIECFADRIVELARHDRAALAEVGAAVKRHVRETSDWRVIGRRYRALAAELIGRG